VASGRGIVYTITTSRIVVFSGDIAGRESCGAGFLRSASPTVPNPNPILNLNPNLGPWNSRTVTYNFIHHQQHVAKIRQ